MKQFEIPIFVSNPEGKEIPITVRLQMTDEGTPKMILTPRQANQEFDPDYLKALEQAFDYAVEQSEIHDAEDEPWYPECSVAVEETLWKNMSDDGRNFLQNFARNGTFSIFAPDEMAV